MTPACPSCKKPLLSRMSPICNRCGALVPKELLYTPEEREKLELANLREINMDGVERREKAILEMKRNLLGL